MKPALILVSLLAAGPVHGEARRAAHRSVTMFHIPVAAALFAVSLRLAGALPPPKVRKDLKDPGPAKAVVLHQSGRDTPAKRLE